MIRIHRRLRDEGRAARLVLQIHDELLLEVPDVETTAVRELVREEMVGAYPLDPPLGGRRRRRRRLAGRQVVSSTDAGASRSVTSAPRLRCCSLHSA